MLIAFKESFFCIGLTSRRKIFVLYVKRRNMFALETLPSIAFTNAK